MKISAYKCHVSFLFIVIAMLSFVLQYYKDVDSQLYLESTNLYSRNSKTIENMEEVLSNNSQNYSFRIFGEIESSGVVRAYYSNKYNSWQPRLNEGHFFLEKDTQEAIVGRRVKTSVDSNGTYYYYNGKKYKVIGYWGVAKSSFLEEQVLLNDSSYLFNEDTSLVLDGDYVAELGKQGISFNGTPLNDKWNPVDNQAFSWKLISMTIILSLISSIIAGVILARNTLKEIRIRHLIGYGFSHNELKILLICFLWFLSCIGIVFGIFILFARERVSSFPVFLLLSNVVLSMVAFYIALKFLRTKGQG